MICLKCGFENIDEAKFCSSCGAEMNNHAIDEMLLNDEQPDAVPAPASLEQESCFQLNTQGNLPEKKRISMGLILAIAGVVLAAAVLALALIPACRGFFVRTFRSPEKLLYTVYRDTVEAAMDNADGNSDKQSDSSVETDTHLLLGDQVISLAASMLYSQPETLEPLSDIGVSCTVNSRDDLYMVLLSLSLSDTQIVDAEYYFDQAQGDSYLVLPDLQEQALFIDSGEILTSDDMQKLESLAQLEVDQELLETLLLRYMKQYFDAFESVNKSSKKVQLQGVSQKVTVLEALMTEKAQYQVLMDIFEALKTDPEAKQFVESFASVLGENCYEDFLELLDSGISRASSCLEDISYENEYLFCTYLSADNSIIGMELTYLEEDRTTEAVSFITVRDGRQIAQRIVLDDDFVVECLGSYDDGLNADYMGWYQDEEVLKVRTENVLMNEYGLCGRITITPSKDTVSGILSSLGLDSTVVQAGNLLDFSIVLVLDGNENGRKTEVSLMAGSSMLVGITHSSQPHQSESFAIPENYVSIDDEEGLEQWGQNIQTEGIEKITQRLEEAGLSDLLLTIAALMLQ